ncbi:MAG: glycosyltransferase [Elusimicrobiota bacterium]|jgi:GT2 family glycosyltransferase
MSPAAGGLPSISVVIPVRDGAADMPRLLKALEKTRHPDCRILVVDDASSDGTAEACAGFPRAKVLRLDRGRGPARARNVGAAAARSELVLFLDSDVELPEASDIPLESARRFQEDPALDALCGPSAAQPLVPGPAAYNAALYHAYYMESIFQGQAAVAGRILFFATRCGAVRRSSFLRSGGFYESLRTVMNEDGEFGTRVWHMGWRTRFDRALGHAHRYPVRFTKLARSYFLTARVQACVDARWENSEDPSISWAEKGRRLLAAALLFLSAGLFLHPGPAVLAAFLVLSAILLLSFGRLGALALSEVPAGLLPSCFLVYVAVTPFILAGYLLGRVQAACGRSYLRGRPSDLPELQGWAG